jgi:hypothetical protein
MQSDPFFSCYWLQKIFIFIQISSVHPKENDMSLKIIATILFLFTGQFLFNTHAQTFIGGDLKNKYTFDSDGSPYIVGENLVIAKSDTVFVKKGTIFLFNNYTGIEVFGSLIVEGEENDPVIFTSINDVSYNPKATTFPNPFDWNGISIDLKSGDVKLYNIKLSYSVFGIKSYNQRMIIKNGVFHDNGQYDLVINETIQAVEPTTPFSYNYREEKNIDSTRTGRRVPLTPYEQKLQNKKVIVFSTLSLGIISGGLSGFFAYKLVGAVNNYDNSHTGSEFKKYTNEKRLYLPLTIVTGAVSIASLTTSLIVQLHPVKLGIEKSTSTAGFINEFYVFISSDKVSLIYTF